MGPAPAPLEITFWHPGVLFWLPEDSATVSL